MSGGRCLYPTPRLGEPHLLTAYLSNGSQVGNVPLTCHLHLVAVDADERGAAAAGRMDGKPPHSRAYLVGQLDGVAVRLHGKLCVEPVAGRTYAGEGCALERLALAPKHGQLDALARAVAQHVTAPARRG